MYFDSVNLFKTEDFINNLNNMYAHRDRNDESRREKLNCHIELTYRYFEFICRQKNLSDVFFRLEKNILKHKSEEVINLWKEMLANTVYMHDMGKINPGFQWINMLNELYKDTEAEKEHSLLGAYIYVSYFSKKIDKIHKRHDRFYLKYFMYLNSYIISRHHGILIDIKNYEELLSDFPEKYSKEKYYPDLNMDTSGKVYIFNSFSNSRKNVKDCLNEDDRLGFYIYIYSKLIFSILTASDYYATSEFMNGEKVDDLGLVNENLKRKFSEDIDKYSIMQSVREYEKNPVHDEMYTNINQLRSEITLEAEKNYLKDKSKNIYYLEAPTGAGKTVTSINLARLMLNSDEKINKLFYVFPFNTLVEQTEAEFMKIFKDDENIIKNISVINSLTPIKTIDEEDYEKSLLNRIFVNYPFVITTHVGLFNFLFGTSREECFPLVNMCNSVIILDEIQSYKNDIWKEIINFLDVYSEILNIRVIIMSATLPRFNKLIDYESENFAYLIQNRKHYFENPYFMNRVKFEMLNLKGEIKEQFKSLMEDIELEGKDNNKILIEFIFRKRADEFYDYMNENFHNEYGHKIVIMTSDDNKVDRKKIVGMAKDENTKLILIATQIIEAGIDIDMDIGYKNISIMDAEEQFMGRINRSYLRNGKVKFFKIDDCADIYKGDVRKEKEFTLLEDDIKDILMRKDFEEYYKRVIDKINVKKREFNDRGYAHFISQLNSLDFKELEKRMKLIDDDQKEYTVFISRDIEIRKDEFISGCDVWTSYKKVLMDNSIGYAEKRVKLSEINLLLNYFIYRVKKIPDQYNELLGDIYYISDGEKYIKNGRFNQDIFTGKKVDAANIIL
ncbi:CRISPR-associated helicase Cas3' [Clostridium fermenticellae]|uniref:CRISPR-associated helicase Cas3 n=1 Tax=Clostridium fermenticellae TaxID=2068654 RepID=A0A386H3D8_9CLOT|nr:CRISPR-associated helicase Cas3' [Clostridium fermenticellae]AYD40231.1 CRISPR-associated helicase Cas3' [Clostridium fermenticellae]